MSRSADSDRKLTMYWLHAAAIADPNIMLEHIGHDDTVTPVSLVDFFLGALPSSRRSRPQFETARETIYQTATNDALRIPAAKNTRANIFPGAPTQAVRPLELAVHAALHLLGEDRCSPKSMQTMRQRFAREFEGGSDGW